MSEKVTEFRGCRNLVFAKVTKDNNESGTGNGYVTGAVKVLAPVAEISKSVESNKETHHYDNRAAIVIQTEGEDKVTLTIAVPDDATLAEITGRTYDSEKKMFIETKRKKEYFALGYILGEEGEDGQDERYVWRYKGMFSIPDETSKTEDDGTSADNMSIEYTGIYTNHIFENGGGNGVAAPAKSAFVRKSDNVSTEAGWFGAVTTPDTTLTPPTPGGNDEGDDEGDDENGAQG